MRRVRRALDRLRRLPWSEGRIQVLEQQACARGQQVGALEQHLRALTQQLGALEENMRALAQQMGVVEECVRVEGEWVWRLSSDLGALRTQVDHLLSSAEVPTELVAEFRDWKARNPVPAEPLVSVCVATYNRARLVTERCIASVLKQSYDRLELIVVGDGCTDDTEQAVARIGDPRITFLNLPQRGSYPSDPVLRWMVAGTPALNRAMSMARGQYVTHLDDDDEYTEDRLEKLVAFAVAHDCDFVWHPFWRQKSDGSWESIEAPHFAHGSVTTSSVFYRSWFANIPWNIDAYRLQEPGDWNRFRRIAYIGPVLMRYPEPLLRHYRERAQDA